MIFPQYSPESLNNYGFAYHSISFKIDKKSFMYTCKKENENMIWGPVFLFNQQHLPWCETPGFHPWNRCGQRCHAQSLGWSPWVEGHVASPSEEKNKHRQLECQETCEERRNQAGFHNRTPWKREHTHTHTQSQILGGPPDVPSAQKFMEITHRVPFHPAEGSLFCQALELENIFSSCHSGQQIIICGESVVGRREGRQEKVWDYMVTITY